MPRIRTIKPEMWESEKLGRLSVVARLNFVGLISLADDEGRGRGDPAFLLARLHPYSTDVTAETMRVAMAELAESGLVVFYKDGPCSFYSIPTWSENQRINRASVSKLPKLTDDSLSPHDILTEPSLSTHARIRDQGPGTKDQGVEGNGKVARQARSITIPPTIEEVSQYCKERKNNIEPEQFVDYYQVRGWKLKGGIHMKDWRAAIRTWERNGNGKSTTKDSDDVDDDWRYQDPPDVVAEKAALKAARLKSKQEQKKAEPEITEAKDSWTKSEE